MKRSLILLTILAASAALVRAQRGASTPAAASERGRAAFTVVEATIADMRTALEQKRVTSRQIVTQYLTRIATYEDKLHAAITVNPRALGIAMLLLAPAAAAAQARGAPGGPCAFRFFPRYATAPRLNVTTLRKLRASSVCRRISSR